MFVQCTYADPVAGTLIGTVYRVLAEQPMMQEVGGGSVYHLVDDNGESFYASSENFKVIPKEMIDSISVHSDPTSPEHYKSGGIETWDYMQAKMTKEQFEGYLLGNVLKYCSRYQHKNGVEDLKKAEVYLKKLIELS